MQQDNTDKILQRIESQQLPDLSHMDKHWEEMQGILVADVVVKPVLSAAAKWMIAATVVTIVALFSWKKGWFSSANNPPTQTQEIAKAIQQPTQLQEPVLQYSDSAVQYLAVTSATNNGVSSTIAQTNSGSFKATYWSANTTTTANRHNDSAKNNTNPLGYESVPILKDRNPVNTIDAWANMSLDKQAEKMNALLMQQFWSNVEKKPQQFNIDNRYDAKVEGAEGTSIKIPANAFPNAGGGEITIELTEYYTYADMIANKLTTSSFQRQLVSDGMLRIRAMQNGAEIKMTGLKPLDVYMPRRDKSPDMQLFAGEVKNFVGDQRLINWIPMGQRQNYRFRDGRENAVLEPYVVRKRLFSKKHVLKYGLNKRDTLTVKTMKPLIQEAYPDDIIKVRIGEPVRISFFKRASRWQDKIYKYGYQLPFKTKEFNQYGYGVRYSAEDRKGDSLASRYEFSVISTGWINCDRFLNDPSPKVIFAVAGSEKEKVYCSYLVFKDLKSVMPAYSYDNKSTFQNIPEGMDVTLISIGISNGKTVCAMKDMKTAKGDVKGMRFEVTNPEDFKQKLSLLKF